MLNKNTLEGMFDNGGKIVNRPLTFIDLFSGCGGLSEGFLQSGNFKGLAHVEWEFPMVETLRHRLVSYWGEDVSVANEQVIHFDIQKTEELLYGNWSSESLQSYGVTNSERIISSGLKGVVGDNEVDLIIGGPPCQAYSIHGRAQDPNSMKDDYRNYLFESFIKVVQEFKPKVLLFENVVGMLTARPGGVHITERIHASFKDAGYTIYSPSEMRNAILDAYDYNVPQHRNRVIIIGIRQDLPIELSDVYNAIISEKSSSHLSVRDAIGDFPKLLPLGAPIKAGRSSVSHIGREESSLKQHNARYHSLRDISVFSEWIRNGYNQLPHKDKIAYYKKITGKDTLYAKYRNLEWDKPSPTVVAHLQKDGFMFIHPDAEQARSITIREAATLMSFPMDFIFLGSNAYCYKMIGNAVPMNFAKHIALGLYKCISNSINV